MVGFSRSPDDPPPFARRKPFHPVGCLGSRRARGGGSRGRRVRGMIPGPPRRFRSRREDPAAWLAFLKSKLLLPSEKKNEDELDPDELAGRLAFRLRRLDAMRKAVNELYEGNLDKRDVFPRGDPQLAKIIRKPLWNNTLHDILKAFGDINVRKVKVQAHVIKRQPVVPLDTARRKLAALVPDLIDWASIQMMRAEDEESKDAPRRSEVASFFSAALELTKDRAVELRQDQPFSDVYVRKARGDTLKAAE